jgi:hypothetical protein
MMPGLLEKFVLSTNITNVLRRFRPQARMWDGRTTLYRTQVGMSSPGGPASSHGVRKWPTGIPRPSNQAPQQNILFFQTREGLKAKGREAWEHKSLNEEGPPDKYDVLWHFIHQILRNNNHS